MYTWYKTAVVCFAHLADVSMRSGTVEGWWEQFHKSRWFTRGWTLQELIAYVLLLVFFSPSQARAPSNRPCRDATGTSSIPFS